jgi:hypothetical protein
MLKMHLNSQFLCILLMMLNIMVYSWEEAIELKFAEQTEHV